MAVFIVKGHRESDEVVFIECYSSDLTDICVDGAKLPSPSLFLS